MSNYWKRKNSFKEIYEFQKHSFKKSPSSITNEIVSSSECSQHLDEDHYYPLGKVMLEYAWREGSKDFREVKWLNSSVSKRSK